MANIQKVQIFTDGACRGNPGPGGWGAILRYKTVEREISGGESHTTNNRMELTAVIQALQKLKRPCEVDLYTDSQYLRNGITEWIRKWKRNGWLTSTREPVKNRDLWEALEALSRRHSIHWHWVKGHVGHPENERCDRLARQAIGD